jgi:hypothetical protein
MVLQNRVFEGRAMTAQEARARWVANNPQLARDANLAAKNRMKARVDAYKAERGCVDCGNDDERVLDLHHRDGTDKSDSINRMRCKTSWENIMKEAAKCDVLCANCHRIRHATEITQARADIQMTTGVFYRAS